MRYLIVDEFAIYKAAEITQEVRDVVHGGMATLIDATTMRYLNPVNETEDEWIKVDDSIY